MRSFIKALLLQVFLVKYKQLEDVWSFLNIL